MCQLDLSSVHLLRVLLLCVHLSCVSLSCCMLVIYHAVMRRLVLGQYVHVSLHCVCIAVTNMTMQFATIATKASAGYTFQTGLDLPRPLFAQSRCTCARRHCCIYRRCYTHAMCMRLYMYIHIYIYKWIFVNTHSQHMAPGRVACALSR